MILLTPIKINTQNNFVYLGLQLGMGKLTFRSRTYASRPKEKNERTSIGVRVTTWAHIITCKATLNIPDPRFLSVSMVGLLPGLCLMGDGVPYLADFVRFFEKFDLIKPYKNCLKWVKITCCFFINKFSKKFQNRHSP